MPAWLVCASSSGRSLLIFDFNVALPVGAIAFYLYDSVMLLHGNEVVFRKGFRAWDWNMGSTTVLFGKLVSAPTLFLPWALVRRACWSEKASVEPSDDSAALALLESALLPVRILCTLMLMLLVIALPLTAMVRGIGEGMLVVFAAFYVLLIASLAILIARRRKLGLDGKALLTLCVDALACAPFAVNLVAKVSLRATPAIDALGFSKAHCKQERDRALRSVVATRIDNLLVFGTPEQRDNPSLLAFSQRLKAESGG